MATSTTYLSLIKPELSDTSKIREDFNTNMDTIDGRFSATYLAVQAKNAVTITGGTITGITITSGVITGITDLAIADGGTGASTATAAFDALAPTTTAGDIIYSDGTNNVRLAKGTQNYVLTMGASIPEWAATAAAGANTALNNLASVAINTALVLGTSDAYALGSTSKMWADLFLASEAVINFNAGNYTITHSAGILTLSGTLALGANNITMTGSLGITGSRLTKVWTAALESTADITINGTALAFIYSPIAGSGSITTIGTVTSGTLSTNAVLADVTMTLGGDADGDIYYRASNKLARLGKGSPAKVLAINAGGTAPEWVAAGAGSVTTSGTPVDDDFAKFTAASVIEGRSYAEVKTDLDLIKCRNNATEAPAVGDDSADGYVVNSIWGDVTNDRSYICLDAAEGSAVWKEISSIDATLALDNLASVAINTSLISDTADTDDLGSPSIEWANLYIGNVGRVYLGLTQDLSIHRSAANTMTLTASSGIICSNGLTVGGILALTTNSITMTGSIGTTGSRVTKGWFTDLAVTDTITISGTAAKGIEITGANTTAQLYIAGSDILANGEQAIWINCPSENGATNGMWISLGSTVTSGDLTGARIKVTTNATSGTQQTRGVYAQAIAAANDDAGLLQGGLFVADVSAGGCVINDVHILCGHYSAGATADINGDLYVGYLRAQTRGADWDVYGHDCLLALENEAVEGAGATLESAIRIFDTNMGVDSFAYGIDMSDASIATADIRLQNGETISNTTDGAIAIGAANLTMTGSIADTTNRVTKGWFTNLEITNTPTVNGTSMGSIYAAIGQTMYIGTTAVTINRSSGALTLAGLTLTTPDIGTPSGGTLTNCTLPIGGVTGLAANVATFLATSSFANLQTVISDKTLINEEDAIILDSMLTISNATPLILLHDTGTDVGHYLLSCDTTESSGYGEFSIWRCTGTAASCSLGDNPPIMWAGSDLVAHFPSGIKIGNGAGTPTDITLYKGETITNSVDGRVTIGGGDLNIDNGKSYMINGTALAYSDITNAASSGANTNITSVLNTALYIGRDADNTISFATDDKILFKTAGNLCMEVLTTGELYMNAFSVVFTEQALSSGTAIAWDLGNSNKATLTAGHNFTITITAPSGAMNAQLIVTQDGTGSRVMDEIVTQSDATIATTDVHTDTEIIDLTIDIPIGARIRFKTDSADLAEPLVVDTVYWAIRSSENHIKVATTKANAIAGTNIDITDTGTGTHTVQQLVKWTDGTLGVLTTAAGAEDIISLTYKTTDEQWYAILGEDFS